MRDEIVGLIDKADIAISSSAGVLEEQLLEPAALSAENARIRLSYPDEILVVALAGGTGSGKSSLANAICDTDAAEVGGIRPTTDQPLALIPPRTSLSIAGYLDELGVTRRKPQKAADWLCLIDLPDIDSVELDHRLRVEQLLPRLDVVIWVLDPEKYRDSVLHDNYLKPLAAYADQFVFVLNQSDRLAIDDVDAVVRDLELALTEDGISSGTVVVTSASPPTGPPVGVEELVEHLARLADGRLGCYEKLLVDLEKAAAGMLAATGGRGIDFERRAAGATALSAAHVAAERPGEAVVVLKAAIEAFAADAGGLSERQILENVAGVPGKVQEIVEHVGSITAERERRLIRWSEPALEPVLEMRLEAAALRIDAELFGPVRKALAARARANATLADLALSAAAVRARARR